MSVTIRSKSAVMGTEQDNVLYLSKSRKVAMADDWYELATAEHFWMWWRLQALEGILAAQPRKEQVNALDIGSGNLVFAKEIAKKFGYAVDCCELNESIADSLPAESNLRVLIYDITERHPDAVGSYDMVFLFDVIEHIDDDVEFLKAAAAHLKPGGLLLVNVPALPVLFSAYDRSAGHVRRYTKTSLAASFRSAGLEPSAIWYWGFFLLPLLLIRNLRVSFAADEQVIDKGFKVPLRGGNSLLKMLGRLERPLFGKLPLGTSLIASAQLGEHPSTVAR